MQVPVRKRNLLCLQRGNIPIVGLLVCAFAFCFSSIKTGWTSTPSKQAHSTHGLSPFFKRTFCHSHENITIRAHTSRNLKRTCYGDFANANSNRIMHPHALEAPRLSALCTSNPYHGFYDCIWPLVHYMSTCMTASDRTRRFVVTDDIDLSAKRKATWVVQAQRAFLHAVHPSSHTLYSGDLPNDSAVCFGRVVGFENNALFRPLRYNMRLVGSTNFSVPHPEPLKRRGLNLFREAILSHYGRSASTFVPDVMQTHVLVYDRTRDSRRRRWLNAVEFVQLLRVDLGSRASIVHVGEISRVFEEQVAMFNDATIVVAPHGAAMVNSLFMRKNSAMVEIASRECKAKSDTGHMEFNEYTMKADPNTWTVWHAGYLDILLAHAPCTLIENGNGDFETDNPSLLELTRSLMDAQSVGGPLSKT